MGTDVLLVASDGQKLSAHICILRQRAPIFFARYLQPVLNVTPRNSSSFSTKINIQINDVNSSGLEFFLRSVYTDEEVENFLTISSSKQNYSDNNEEEEGGFKFNEIKENSMEQNCSSNNTQKNVSKQRNMFSGNNGHNNMVNNI